MSQENKSKLTPLAASLAGNGDGIETTALNTCLAQVEQNKIRDQVRDAVDQNQWRIAA